MLWLPLVLAAACPLPDLPDSLSKLVPSYEVTGAANTFGRFLLPGNSTRWTFAVPQEALVRLSLDPVNVNIEASIRTKAKLYSKKAIPVDSHGVLTTKLKAGSYALTLQFEAELSDEDSEEVNTEDCRLPYAYLSLAIAPLSQLDKLSKTELKAYKAGFPALDFADALQDFRSFKQMDPARYIDISSIPDEPLGELKAYQLQAREPSEEERSQGHTGLWALSFSVHHEFVEFGGVLLLIAKEREEAPSSLQCVSSGDCSISHGTEKNSAVLYTTLTPGNYTLWAMYLGISDTERATLKEHQGGFLPFSVDFQLDPLPEREDRFNCEAGRLPVSLNGPGLLDSAGFLSYHDNVYADIYATKQQTHITLSLPSVLRLVTVEPAGVGVDMRVFGAKGETVAISATVGGTEGILVELDKGGYTLQFVYEQTMVTNPRHLFCETFRIELDIMPQRAAAAYVTQYGLDSCEDDSETISNLLNEHFTKLKKDGKGGFVFNPVPGTHYKLPLKSISKGDETLFQYEFTLPASAYVYFEVFSHPVLADLTLSLQLELENEEMEDVFGDMKDTLSLERYSRRAFHGQINPGSYLMALKSGPGARNQGKSKPLVTDSAFQTLPKCVVLQLKVEVLPMSDTKYQQWACGGVSFSLAPNTLNTVDKLGLKGANQAIMPEAGLFAEQVLAPDNRKSKEAESFGVFVDQESVLRASFASEQGGMIVILKSGTKEIARTGSKSQDSNSLFLTSTLQQHQAYTLFMYFYPSEASGCPVYDLNLEIRTSDSIPTAKSANSCKETIPTAENLVQYRTLDDPNPQFDMSSGEYSSSLHDTDYKYYRGEEAVRFSVPFDIKTQAAVVTAHLQAGFVETGLRFFIEEREEAETVAVGFFASSHRMEAHAVILSQGQYCLVIEETGEGPGSLCNEFSAAVLVEAADQWSSYEDLLRKTNGCGFPALPASLNLIGELEEGELHWHRELPLDADNMGHRMAFTLQETSIVHLVVDHVPDITFYGRFFKANQKPYQMLMSRDAGKGIHTKLEPGAYLLDLVYGSESDLPHPSECATHWLDFQIVPETLYTQLAEANSCSVSSALPAALNMKKPGESKYMIYTGALYDVKVKVELSVDSEVLFELTYEAALAGPMFLQLHNSQGQELQTSIGVQDYSTLAAVLPAGSYVLRLYNTLQGSELPPVCTKVTLAYWAEETSIPGTICEGGLLPEKLFSEEAKPYGGPQAKDGSVSFYGVFKVPVGKSTEAIMLRAGETSIARILHISGSSGISIESALYQDTKLKSALGYSKSAGKVGSFILELQARHEPYVLGLSFLSSRKAETCLSFELAIAVELKTTVKEQLTCDPALKSRSLLPDLSFSLSGKETKGGLDYTIKGAWLVGDPKDFPKGVTSKGTKNGSFVYEMQLDIRSPGRFSAFAEFNFLTNDLYLQVLKADRVLGKSQWTVMGESLQDLQLSSGVEDLKLGTGLYTLVLRQAVAANHLTQMFSDVDLCFSFAFAVEFEAESATEQPEETLNTNKLVSIMPTGKAGINPSQGLAITVTWEEAVHKGKDGSFVKAFYLESDKRAKIHPSSVRQEKSKPQRLELTFKAGQLSLDSCFTLHMNVKDFDLEEDEPQPEFDFPGDLKYCTGNCYCNPHAEARCNEDMECVCSSPYSGVTCEECISGYSFEADTKLCIKDECESCPGSCVAGKCESVSVCECGNYGSCSKDKCKCSSGYTGEHCDTCEDEDMTFPACIDCQYDKLPTNITYVEGRDKGKASINRKGEFTLDLERVEKKMQAVSFRLQKESEVILELSGTLQETKVYLSDAIKKPYKPQSDESDNGVRTLKWTLKSSRSFVIVIKSEAQFHCDVLGVSLHISPSEDSSAASSKPVPEPLSSPRSSEDQCQGHGLLTSGKCVCDIGYTGSSCGKCDDGFDQRPSGICIQRFAPPIISPSLSEPVPVSWTAVNETSWSTTVVGWVLFAVAIAALYYLYKHKEQGGVHWHRVPANPTGFEGPEDEEEERVGLQGRSL